MKKYVFLIFLILTISCQQKKENGIDSIEVLYYNGQFNRAEAVYCKDIIYSQAIKDIYFEALQDSTHVPQEAIILDTIISDKRVLHEIELELGKQKNIIEDYVDARMKCYIMREGGQVDSLCIGNNPIYALYNNQPVKLSNKFAYLIRENCGFYKWFNIDMLKYFDELNDPSFEREKVISYAGEEY
jgi:hypothetical protein